jgi:hypothetical protein
MQIRLCGITKYILNLIPSSYLLSGGGDYRGIYDIGLKRAFMGYVGLLLNAPYKIDSMVWMRMLMTFFLFVSCFFFLFFCLAILTRGYFEIGRSQNGGVQGFWGYRGF